MAGVGLLALAGLALKKPGLFTAGPAKELFYKSASEFFNSISPKVSRSLLSKIESGTFNVSEIPIKGLGHSDLSPKIFGKYTGAQQLVASDAEKAFSVVTKSFQELPEFRKLVISARAYIHGYKPMIDASAEILGGRYAGGRELNLPPGLQLVPGFSLSAPLAKVSGLEMAEGLNRLTASPDTVKIMARELINAISASVPKNERFYRGFALDTKMAEKLFGFRIGEGIFRGGGNRLFDEIPAAKNKFLELNQLSSFSKSSSVANSFGNGPYQIFLETHGPFKFFNVSLLNHFSEAEVLSFGKFKILSGRQVRSQTGQYYKVKIQQVLE